MKPFPSVVSRSILTCAALFAAITSAPAGSFVPIPLLPSSFNEDVVMEKSGPAPSVPKGYTTASMDNGVANTGYSWYEQGFETGATTTGLPHPGATFTSAASPTHSFMMAPSYTNNNGIMLDANITNATFTFTAPAAYTKLSLLTSGGNGGGVI